MSLPNTQVILGKTNWQYCLHGGWI